MKLFEEPMVEVINFAVEDIVTESTGEPDIGGDIGSSCL